MSPCLDPDINLRSKVTFEVYPSENYNGPCSNLLLGAHSGFDSLLTEYSLYSRIPYLPQPKVSEFDFKDKSGVLEKLKTAPEYGNSKLVSEDSLKEVPYYLHVLTVPKWLGTESN